METTSTPSKQSYFLLTIQTRNSKSPVHYAVANPSDFALYGVLYHSILVKILSNFETARYAETEGLLDTDPDFFADWICGLGPITVNDTTLTLSPLTIPDSALPSDTGTFIVSINEETGTGTVVSEEEETTGCEYIDIITAESIPSPFLQPSPFIVCEGKQYLANKEGNPIGEPYSAIQPAYGVWIVFRETGGGLIGRCGEEILSCECNRIGMEPGSVISFDRNGLTGFYLPYTGQLCEAKYRDIDFGDGEDPILVLLPTGWAYLDSDLVPHPIGD